MPRRPPNMRITVVDSPTLPAAFRRQSLPVFTTINESTSPIKQTFLLSPSPTSTVFCTDSPILGSSLVTPTTTYTCTSPSSIPASIAGAYPTPRFYSPSIAAQSYRSSSRYSNWSTDPTLVEGMLTPRLATISDILPDDTDLYVDERPQTIRWSVMVSEAQQQESAEMDLGPEIRGELPMIGEGDFSYYPPLLSRFSTFGRMDEAQHNGEGKDTAKKSVKRFALRRCLKKIFGKKGGVRRL